MTYSSSRGRHKAFDIIIFLRGGAEERGGGGGGGGIKQFDMYEKTAVM